VLSAVNFFPEKGKNMQRKSSIRFVLTLGMIASLAVSAFAQAGTPAIPAFDEFMNTIMKNYGIPGGAIAVSQNGRLLMARGYGMADKDNNIPVQANSLFRLASLSKLITSVTIMHLVEQGKLSVSQPAFALLPDLQAAPGTNEDPRLKSITIANLLTHSGGWDIGALGYDPMFYGQEIAAALHVASPASTENIIRYMRGQPLNFDPGSKYVYSNFGYAILGRIIERVTGMSYEQYVRTNVLAPMGITGMRTGQTLSAGQLPNEVRYYSDGANGANIFPGAEPATVALPYGTWYMEAMDSHGGWVASVIDYVKLMNALEGRRGKAFLQPSSIAAMTACPPIPQYQGLNSWYGFGLVVVQEPAGEIWWHNGGLDGTETYEIRTDNGFDWVVFFNKR
jgi:N-acyl-D-amino-acid deacylase